MKVKALARGQYGGEIKHKGTVFTWAGDELPNWVEPVEGDKPKPKAKPKPEKSKPEKGADLA